MIPTGRRVPMLICLYAALAVAWGFVSLGYQPKLSQFFEAGLMALGLSLAFVLALGWWDGRAAANRPDADRPWDRRINVSLIVVGSAFLAVTVRTGEEHDYIFYVDFWATVRQGEDPWYITRPYWGAQPPNAYGPLFNLLAGPAYLNALAPKLLFASAYIVSASLLVKGLVADRRPSMLGALGLMAWAWNPYAWVEVAIRGHFDVLVGLASVAAVHARRRGQDFNSAAALAAGVLLKYIPIALLPFLALDRGKIRLRFVAASTALVALGMGLSCLAWGPSTFRPLGFAASRSSTYLSIFRFLRGQHSPFRWFGIQADLDRLGMPVLALALLVAWWWCRARRADPATSAVLAVLVALLFYRNGFPQYQMVLLMLASYWIAETWQERRHRTALVLAMLCYFGWISAFVVAYCVIGDGSTSFEDAVGLPTFVLGSAMGMCLAWSEPVRSGDPSPGPAGS